MSPVHREIRPSILYFGTPVVIISSTNSDGTTNIAPMSSAWSLEYTVVLGLGASGQTIANLRRHGVCVLNVPLADLWREVEALGRTTGRADVPEYQRARGILYESDKYAAVGLTAVMSEYVRPTGVLECPLRLECEVQSIDSLKNEVDAVVVQTRVLRVTADETLVVANRHINPARWNPLIYSFRHYFGLGEELGAAGHSETRDVTNAMCSSG